MAETGSERIVRRLRKLGWAIPLTSEGTERQADGLTRTALVQINIIERYFDEPQSSYDAVRSAIGFLTAEQLAAGPDAVLGRYSGSGEEGDDDEGDIPSE